MKMKQVTEALNSPLAAAITRALVIVGSLSVPVIAFAAARWFDERVMQAPAVVAVSQRAETTERAVVESLAAAKELTRIVGELQKVDAALGADVKAAHVSNAAIERQLVILQTQLSAQRAEDLRRFEDITRKLDKIGDRLAIP